MEQSGFFWLLATRSFLPNLKKFPVCWNFQCFTFPCHCCGHTCGWWWLCFVTSDTAYASPVPKVLDWASWLPCQVHSMPLTWHKEKKLFPFFFFLLFSHQSVISIWCSCCRKRLYYLCELWKLVAHCCEPAGFKWELQFLGKILCSRWSPLTYHMAHQWWFTVLEVEKWKIEIIL